MIGYLKGKIIVRYPQWVILENGGVGYRINLPSGILVAKGDEAEFFIYHHFRQDSQELYGLKSLEQLEFFELLLIVPGVGPKMALNIIGSIKIEVLEKSIVKGDPNYLTSISGVGKKLAAKIIVELKNKLTTIELGQEYLPEESSEVVEALTTLGYRRGEILAILKEMPEGMEESQDQIKWILKNIKR
jgi:Holliday junction DNA helicase RuvA